ncbi:unnamed protein product [Pleuronectes platessa]|uniref:Uncharacterized protein n=1 Tax=Pleuronectes platessa TaxID=8262 RepID=A0A9N7U4V5_PLEPL|nr:unnamed protein product [Pleuronectes platessa]
MCFLLNDTGSRFLPTVSLGKMLASGAVPVSAHLAYISSLTISDNQCYHHHQHPAGSTPTAHSLQHHQQQAHYSTRCQPLSRDTGHRRCSFITGSRSYSPLLPFPPPLSLPEPTSFPPACVPELLMLP